MSNEDVIAQHRRYNDEVLNRGDLDLLAELVAPDYVDHMAGGPELRGPEGLRRFIAAFLAAFPDARFTVHDRVVQGEKVAVRWSMRGTHRGAFNGIQPTGRTVTTTGLAIHRFVAGRLAESWEQFDALGLLQQLDTRPEAAPEGRPVSPA